MALRGPFTALKGQQLSRSPTEINDYPLPVAWGERRMTLGNRAGRPG